MSVTIGAWLGGALAIWATVTRVYDAVVKFAGPIVATAEELAKDGIINKDDRKKIVLAVIEKLQAEGKIKIPWFVKPFVGRVVDAIAKKLPDFVVAKLATKTAKEVIIASADRNYKKRGAMA